MVSTQRLRRGQSSQFHLRPEDFESRPAGEPWGHTRGEDMSSPCFVWRSHRTNSNDPLQAFSPHEADEIVTMRPVRRNELLEA